MRVAAVLSAAFQSPPSRAAWIEIEMAQEDEPCFRVAAFTGGVD